MFDFDAMQRPKPAGEVWISSGKEERTPLETNQRWKFDNSGVAQEGDSTGGNNSVEEDIWIFSTIRQLDEWKEIFRNFMKEKNYFAERKFFLVLARKSEKKNREKCIIFYI